MPHSATTTYRQQQAELSAIMASLSELTSRQDAMSHVLDIVAMLNRLSAKVTDVLTLEDKVLFPRLLNHPDARVREAARRVQEEGGHLQPVFDDYFAIWSSPPAIVSRFPAFARETRMVLRRMQDRCRQEGEELFPLVDQAGLH
ncbi:hemerythrin domain-containing protein [Azospirillum fermentarium]|uniref:hemerythrin domain-containing protein n=1 Tax=Azospirillum fermentarium TaxID=1233114 RepID=UPI0022276E5D|nr:hemerythrin domain-containing protein [Azospirillum fermentarium]